MNFESNTVRWQPPSPWPGGGARDGVAHQALLGQGNSHSGACPQVAPHAACRPPRVLLLMILCLAACVGLLPLLNHGSELMPLAVGDLVPSRRSWSRRA